MQQYTPAELTEAILPHLASSLSAWQYLSARATAVASVSSPATSSPAAIPTDVDSLNVDVGAMLDEYAALHESVRVFCDKMLENDADSQESLGKDSVASSTVPHVESSHQGSDCVRTVWGSCDELLVKDTMSVDDQDQVAQGSTEKGLVASSAVQDVENGHQESDLIASTKTAAVPNTDSMQSTDDHSADRSFTFYSGTLQNGDSSTVGNCSEDILSVHVNGKLLEFDTPQNPADRILIHNGEANQVYSGELFTGSNTESLSLDRNKSRDTENSLESNGSNRTVSKITVESVETNGSLTLSAADSVELLKSDCCKTSCGTYTVDMTETGIGDAVEKGIAETAVTDCKEDRMSSPTADNIQRASNCHTEYSESASEAVRPEVIVIDDVLEVSSVHTVNKCSEITSICSALYHPHNKYSPCFST